MSVIATKHKYTRESDGAVFHLSLFVDCTPDHPATWLEPACGGEPIACRVKYRDDPRNEGLTLTEDDESRIEDWVHDIELDWDVHDVTYDGEVGPGDFDFSM